ncbi:MAG: OsmC family protein [Rhodospirillales bacterium]|nr:OsmC family protein [Rhodospirillales bacterium]
MTKTPLEEIGDPLYYIAGNATEAGFPVPPNPHGQSLRTWVRSLGGMQKEALVVSAATGTAWRFACDEAAHLGGHNKAPNPLTYLSTGMISSYMNEITALAEQRKIGLGDLKLILDNFYYREGDFRKGTMTSGALPPELSVACEADCNDQTLNTLLYEAVAASPLNGLARGVHPSLFTLIHNGNVITPEQVTPLKADPFPNPGDNFPKLIPAADSAAVPSLIEYLMEEDEKYGAFKKTRTNSPDLGADKLLLHMHSTCVQRDDGIKEIYKEQYGPATPSWKYLSDEAEGFGGHGRAPDAASLISAGIGLCFMTQIGRFAHMAKLPLTGYSIIQDTHFSLGGASGGTGQAGVAQPVETHVYMETETGDDVAQQILGVAERTCFLHAFCRDDLKPKVRALKPSRTA